MSYRADRCRHRFTEKMHSHNEQTTFRLQATGYLRMSYCTMYHSSHAVAYLSHLLKLLTNVTIRWR